MATTDPARRSGAAAPLWRRIAWLVVFWCAGVASLLLVAFALRLALGAAGLTA